jgi:hypothetical protein
LRKKYYLCGSAAVLFFVLRAIDTLLFINPETGYYDGGSVALRVAGLVLLAVASSLLANWFRPACAIPEKKEKNPLAALFFLLAGIAALIGSASEIANALKLILPLGRAITYICCLLGVAAAVWFILAARWLTNDRQAFGRFVTIAVILWYCFRALTEFVRAPINANNSVVLVSLASELIMASFFLALGRYLSLEGDKADFAKKTLTLAFPALLFVAGVGGATLITYIKAGETANAALAAADALGAVGGYLAAATFIKKDDEEKAYEQQKTN